jgi:hypothetical protein
MARARVNAGICGYTADIVVRKRSKRIVEVKIESECEMVEALGEEIRELDWSKGVLETIATSDVYRAASKHLKHVDCPVPCAVLKAIEVEVGIALPKKVSIEIEK